MAYHQLETTEQGPIIPNQPPEITSLFNEDISTWIKATDPSCEEFSGIGGLYTYDSNSGFVLYLKQFKYNGYCFMGYIPTIIFRGAHVSNAFLGYEARLCQHPSQEQQPMQQQQTSIEMIGNTQAGQELTAYTKSHQSKPQPVPSKTTNQSV